MQTITQKAEIFVGIDISKDELVTAYKLDQKWIKEKIANNGPAIDAWLKKIKTSKKCFILEYTGNYSDRTIHSLNENGAVFSVVNPAQSRAMSKVLTKTNKTDDQDAQTLALLGERNELKPYRMPSEQQKKRKEAYSALVSLQKQERQLRNQLHAFDFRVNPSSIVVDTLKDVLATTQKAIEKLQKELNPEQNEKEDLETIKLISSIKSVGKVTATACVTQFGNLKQFETAKAFVKFIGLSPSEFTSGKTVRGKSSITKKGSGKLRSLLFNCARNAIRFNKNCKELYLRLVEKGKNGKTALTAVMHKLARQIFGVIHSGEKYDPDFASNKQIVAQ